MWHSAGELKHLPLEQGSKGKLLSLPLSRGRLLFRAEMSWPDQWPCVPKVRGD